LNCSSECRQWFRGLAPLAQDSRSNSNIVNMHCQGTCKRGPKQPPSAPRPSGRPTARTCTLRDTFFGHPASVYPGPSKILAHRAQARGGLRPTPRTRKTRGCETPAGRLGSKQPPSAPRPSGRQTARTCALRDTFFGHPASVYPGPSKILAHRAQARGGLRPTPRTRKTRGCETPAGRLGSEQPPSAPRPSGRQTARTCTLRDTFFGHPASVYPGPSKILAHRAQAARSRRDRLLATQRTDPAVLHCP